MLAPMLLDVPSALCIHRLRVEPVVADVTAHASKFLFLSVDSAPLRLPRLTAEFVGHYNSAVVIESVGQLYLRHTLRQAAWLVGSLGFLGSPVARLRRIASAASTLLAALLGPPPPPPPPSSAPSVAAATTSLAAAPLYPRQPGAGRLGRVAVASGQLLSESLASVLSSVETAAKSVGRNVSRFTLDEFHHQLAYVAVDRTDSKT